MATARRHHFVSQCYLNGFVADREKPKLFVVDRETQNSFETSPANVAAERDFHRIDIEGHEPDALENSFAEFETDVDQALKRIVASQSIAAEKDRALVFELMAILATKNPRLRGITGDMRTQVVKMMMDLATSSPERWAAQVKAAKRDGYLPPDTPDNYQEMRDLVQSGAFVIETPVMEHLRVELQSIETVLPYITGRKWILFKSPPGASFITSDHPISLMWSNPAERHQMQPPGYGVAETQILFPISRELAMIGAFELEEEERNADLLQVAQINGSTFLHSKRQVYGRDGSFPYIFARSKEIGRGDQLLTDPILYPVAPSAT